jgi:hypothetical protein
MTWLIILLSTLLPEKEFHKVRKDTVMLLSREGSEEQVYTWLRLTCNLYLEDRYPGFWAQDRVVQRFMEALHVDPTCKCCGKDLHLTDAGNATAYRIGGDSEQGFELICDVHVTEA